MVANTGCYNDVYGFVAEEQESLDANRVDINLVSCLYNAQVIAARALAEREAREARGEVEDDEDETLPTIRVGLVDADGHYTDVEPDL